MNQRYRGIISSDWSQCLSPSGPFDVISFHYPDLKPQLSGIFKNYTGNIISLSEAYKQVRSLLPLPVTEEHMDTYLDQHFQLYHGVADLIEWCLGEKILFMINTTNVQGYFQRVFAKGLLPSLPALSAHPMIRFPSRKTDPPTVYDLLEIHDKPKNTVALMKSHHIGPEKVILMGDSGGDGPHFEWGAKVGATLVASMPKWSLEIYCKKKKILVNKKFGVLYSQGEERDLQREMQFDFMDLVPLISESLNL